MNVLKISFSILSAIGLVIFLVLWLFTRADLATTQEKLQTTASDLFQAESNQRGCEQNLTQSNSKLNSVQSKLDKATTEATSKDQQLTTLTEQYRTLQNKLTALENQTPAVPEPGHIESTESVDPEFLNQLGALTARLVTVTQERDLYLNQRDEARKTLETLRVSEQQPAP
ncbi:MAG: hypothetical protein LBT47_07825 [Deltaproteobacteria bacterium]|jgi:chromosome segregation ATPase|nr:hypothetical protein [Deltaproteobacteria bacterium]